MSQWGSAKGRKVLTALLRIGWTIKRESADRTGFFRALAGQTLSLHFVMQKKSAPECSLVLGREPV